MMSQSNSPDVVVQACIRMDDICYIINENKRQISERKYELIRDKIVKQLDHNNVGKIVKIAFDLNADKNISAIVYFEDPIIVNGRAVSLHSSKWNVSFWQHIVETSVQLYYDPTVYDRAATAPETPQYYTCSLYTHPETEQALMFDGRQMTDQLIEHRQEIAQLKQTIAELEIKVTHITDRCETLIYYLANGISPHSMWEPK